MLQRVLVRGGHQHNQNHNNHSGHKQAHQQGHSHRGRTYRNFCYRSGWQGWTTRRWSLSRGCWMFWCPGTCWYIYYASDGMYVPCDECTDPNAND